MQPTLAETILFVIDANKGLYDKVGKPKVLHSLEVMNQLKYDTEGAQMVGLLHDIVEDTKVTEDVLRFNGYEPYIIDAVHALTRKINEPYFEYIQRVKDNHLAARVKIADAGHNLGRCQDKMDEFGSLAKKYEKVLKELAE